MNHFHSINTHRIRLGLAVRPLDSFTKEAPISPVTLVLNGAPTRAYYNPQSGYWSVPDLKPGAWTLVVEARYYYPSLPMEIELIPGQTTYQRQFTVWLQTRADYPYPAGTQISGQVISKQEGLPLTEAKVEAKYSHEKTITTTTDDRGRYRGRYTLFFDHDDPTTLTVNLTFEKEGYANSDATVEAKYNQTTIHKQELTRL